MHVSKGGVAPPRRTQEQRRGRTRAALLEAAARGLSRYGYGNLVLEDVAAEAGYTRGALYHQFRGKEELAMAVLGWVAETWEKEVWERARREEAPADVLIAVARGHVIFCRRDIARVAMALRVEFAERDHPVGRTVEEIVNANARRLGTYITAGRRDGSIPPGPPAVKLALAGIGAVEGLAIQVAGMRPHDAVIAERLMRGMLGLAPAGV